MMIEECEIKFKNISSGAFGYSFPIIDQCSNVVCMPLHTVERELVMVIDFISFNDQ